jgi:hypothetical protein
MTYNDAIPIMDRVGENEELVFSMKSMNRCYNIGEMTILVYLKRKCVVDRNPVAGVQCYELNLQTNWGEGVGAPTPTPTPTPTPPHTTTVTTIVVEHATPTIVVPPIAVDPFATVDPVVIVEVDPVQVDPFATNEPEEPIVELETPNIQVSDPADMEDEDSIEE